MYLSYLDFDPIWIISINIWSILNAKFALWMDQYKKYLGKNPFRGIWWKGFKTKFVMWQCFFQIELACIAICGSNFLSPIKSLEPTKIKWKKWFWTCFLFVQSLGRVKPTLLITRSTIHPWFPPWLFIEYLAALEIIAKRLS